MGKGIIQQRGYTKHNFVLFDEFSPTICCNYFSDMTPYVFKILENKKDMESNNLPKELQGKKFRVRKLTNRECYRLMDVDEESIDKLLSTPISKTGHYKLAGNSIVVNVLYHIFRKLLIENENESQQLTLF